MNKILHVYTEYRGNRGDRVNELVCVYDKAKKKRKKILCEKICSEKQTMEIKWV